MSRETQIVQEHVVQPAAGAPMLGLLLLAIFGAIGGIIYGGSHADALTVVASIVVVIASFIGLFGLTIVNPNDARVMILFGSYQGVINEPGFYWVNPFNIRRRVSLRVRNFETGVIETPEVK